MENLPLAFREFEHPPQISKVTVDGWTGNSGSLPIVHKFPDQETDGSDRHAGKIVVERSQTASGYDGILPVHDKLALVPVIVEENLPETLLNERQELKWSESFMDGSFALQRKRGLCG